MRRSVPRPASLGDPRPPREALTRARETAPHAGMSRARIEVTDLPVIARYFPEYETEIGRRLRAG